MISSADPDGHWTPCVWPFEPAEYSEESRRFGAQSHVRVTAWHDEQSVEFSLAEEPEEAADEKEQEKKAASVDRDRATLVSEEEDNGEEEDEEGEDEASESAAAGDGDDEDAGESAAAGGGAAEATGEDEAKEEEEEEDGSDGEEPMAPPIERTRRWMLADKARTSAISGAIVQTVESATAKATGTGTVVCVGGGSGLCASAASGTCKHVIAVEWTEDHATAVRGGETTRDLPPPLLVMMSHHSFDDELLVLTDNCRPCPCSVLACSYVSTQQVWMTLTHMGICCLLCYCCCCCPACSSHNLLPRDISDKTLMRMCCGCSAVVLARGL